MQGVVSQCMQQAGEAGHDPGRGTAVQALLLRTGMLPTRPGEACPAAGWALRCCRGHGSPVRIRRRQREIPRTIPGKDEAAHSQDQRARVTLERAGPGCRCGRRQGVGDAVAGTQGVRPCKGCPARSSGRALVPSGQGWPPATLLARRPWTHVGGLGRLPAVLVRGGGGVAQPGEALAKVLGFSRSQSRGAPRPQLTFPWRGDCSPPPTSLWSHLGAWGFALTFASSLCPRSWAPGLSVSKGLAAFVQGMYTPLLTYFPSLNSLFRFYAWDMCGGVGRGELFPPPCTKLSCFHLVQGLGEVRAG